MNGTVGVFTWGFRSEEVPIEWASELEELGYASIWIPGGSGGHILDVCDRVLDATRVITVAAGVLNIWRHEPAEVAERSMALGQRFLLGVGISNRNLIEEYRSPIATMRRYLDDLDAAGHDPARRAIASLNPKMTELAGQRSLGTHPLCMPPSHATWCRELIGPDKLVYPCVAAVLETDPDRARAVARGFTSTYLRLPNYASSLRRLGWSDADLANGGSDAVVDAVVAWGDADTVAAKVRAHHEAGATGACVQVLSRTESPRTMDMDGLRALAPALFPDRHRTGR
jgi:probable F420-dependent oxidoreductase